MKRVGVVLSGCGAQDGTEIREAVLLLLAIERAGGEAVVVAPEATCARVVDHGSGAVSGEPRSVRAEAARIARGPVGDLASLGPDDVDGVVFPGGQGVATVLSNYSEKEAVCDVHPDVVRLLKGCLARRYPIGLVCLAPILAARVLGPGMGVRLTLGPRGSAPAKHAAVMGAEVRPCAVRDVIVDDKARVVSTPAYMIDDARLADVAVGIDKLTRAVMSFARDRNADRNADAPGRPAAGATRARGSA